MNDSPLSAAAEAMLPRRYWRERCLEAEARLAEAAKLLGQWRATFGDGWLASDTVAFLAALVSPETP